MTKRPVTQPQTGQDPSQAATVPYNTRRLKDADGDALMALYQSGIRDYPNGFLPSPEEAATYSWAKINPHFQALFGVFTTDLSASRAADAPSTHMQVRTKTSTNTPANTLVGFCGYNGHGFERLRHRAEIGPFFVAPEHQGTRAAHALMDAIKAHAHRQHISRLDLYVESRNTRAIAFYKKHGFVVQALLKDMVRVGADHQDDLFCTFYL